MIAVAIRAARAALAEDPDGLLHAFCRRRIWLAMGPSDPLPKKMTAAHQCRALLALYCAEKVLPIWVEKWPRRKKPPQLLIKALEVVRLGSDPVTLKSEADHMWTAGEDVQYQYGAGPEAEVLFALSRAVTVTYHDEYFGEEDALQEVKDPLHDPWSWDAAYIAAEGHAQRHAPTPSETSARRREFWRFYLDEALPRALDTSRLLSP